MRHQGLLFFRDVNLSGAVPTIPKKVKINLYHRPYLICHQNKMA